VQDATLSAEANVPEAHAAHARSCVVVPADVTYEPAAHVVHGTHAVDGSPSSSQVPDAHAAFGVAPPAQ
jgi:hypothetical protein